MEPSAGEGHVPMSALLIPIVLVAVFATSVAMLLGVARYLRGARSQPAVVKPLDMAAFAVLLDREDELFLRDRLPRPAGARSATAHRSGRLEDTARPLGPHARRTSGAADRRCGRRAEVSGHRRNWPAGPDDDVREPRPGDGVRSAADQLSAGSGGADASTCLNPPKTATRSTSRKQSTAANPAWRNHTS